jgi:ELWxxDGT repeat protein
MKMQLTVESLENRRLLAANILADFGGIYPTQSVTVNGTSYFAANDGTHGSELWKSDGTIAGTVMVKDLTPGSGSAEFDGMFAVSNRLLFFTPDPNHQNTFALWSSDGSSAGTVRLCHAGVTVASSAAVLGNELLFSVASGRSSTDQATLWASDGTVGGTQQVYLNIFQTLAKRWNANGKNVQAVE